MLSTLKVKMSKKNTSIKDSRARDQTQAIVEMKNIAPHLDFSKFTYVNESVKSTVIHPKLGEIQNSYRNIIRSKGSVRGQDKKKSNEKYLQELTEALTSTGDLEKYDLSKVNYVKATQKVTIICKKHGDKGIAPFHLLNGRRCGECKGQRLSDHFRNDWIEVRLSASQLHGDKYDYSKFNYVNGKTPSTIVCKKCSKEFSMDMDHHLRGNGCTYCSKVNRHELFLEEGPKKFLEKAILLHGSRYTYNNMEYLTCLDKIRITCSKVDKDGNPHGDFSVTPAGHINSGSGCPKCSNKVSLAEIQIGTFIKGLGLEILCNVPILGRHHIDIFVPSLNIGVEYCGLYWHSENNKVISYHVDKYLAAKEKGIHLIQIFEDEWINSPDKVKSVLTMKLGKGSAYIPARKTLFKEIPNSSAKDLYNVSHMQGGNTSLGKSFGLIHEGVLVASMSFSVSNVGDGIIDLARFASRGRVSGGFSKLLKNAIPLIKSMGINTIISFSDNRWSDGGVYSTSGFTNVTEGTKLVPRYWWVRGTQRFHRRLFQRKHLRIMFGETFKEDESEAKNSRRHGYYKIYDAGVTKWKLDI